MKNAQSGMALIIVLWITIVLTSITAAAAYLARLEMKQAYYPARDMQLIGASIAGLERVKSELLFDNNYSYDSLKGNWKCGYQDYTKIGDIDISIIVEDEESKLNLNTAAKECINKFPPLIDSPNAVILIKALTVQLDCLEQLTSLTPEDTKLSQTLKKTATINSEGKININTAPVEVLMTLPEVDYTMAQAIIARRNGKDLIQGTEDDLPYDNIMKVQEITGTEVYKKISNLITVKSSNFKVTIKTSFGKYSKIVESVLSRQGNFIHVRYWRET
ncbi:MAG: hypothetical protein A3J83_08805 [Elusimicrobia bacterium RIFOXYA2_FULL_40_6]|nr:MAG: hypothetical protein A3J83_08805 [Elusimicrobia bacterium RIFOXYA2_FULL_40_6]